jgi:hypothetical protein
MQPQFVRWEGLTGNISDLCVFQERHYSTTRFVAVFQPKFHILQTTGSDQEDALQLSVHLSFIM